MTKLCQLKPCGANENCYHMNNKCICFEFGDINITILDKKGNADDEKLKPTHLRQRLAKSLPPTS